MITYLLCILYVYNQSKWKGFITKCARKIGQEIAKSKLEEVENDVKEEFANVIAAKVK